MSLSARTDYLMGSVLPALSTIVFGIALVMMTIPLIISDWLSAHGNPVLGQLQKEQKVDESDLRRFVYSRERSAKWKESATIYTDIALGRLILGNYLSPEDHPGNLERAEASLRKGLALAPMNPYGWMRLAQVRKARHATVSEIAGLLKLTLKSGQHEDKRHAMLLLMVEMGLEAWSQLDEPERDAITQKVHKAWGRDPRGTADLATRTGHSDLLAKLLGF